MVGQPHLTVTPAGARGLEEIAQELGLKSKSELVDQIGRRIFLVSPNPAAIGRRIFLVSPNPAAKENIEESVDKTD